MFQVIPRNQVTLNKVFLTFTSIDGILKFNHSNEAINNNNNDDDVDDDDDDNDDDGDDDDDDNNN